MDNWEVIDTGAVRGLHWQRIIERMNVTIVCLRELDENFIL